MDNNNESDTDLEERLRWHTYPQSPTVTNYLTNQRSDPLITEEYMYSSEQLSVRERHLSGVSVASSGQHSFTDQMDCHERCITPVPNNENRSFDVRCQICHSIAINPFRCTPRQINGVVVLHSSQQGHLLCYQCMSMYMRTQRSSSVSCPYCQINNFDLDNLVPADDHIIIEAEKYFIHCPNGCGLMGSPLVMAHNHICVLQNVQLPGHTLNSNIVANLLAANTNLNQELFQAKADMRDVFKKSKIAVEYWRSQCMASQMSQQTQRENYSKANDKLLQRIQELVGMYDNIREEKIELKRKFKQKLNFLAKFYQTKVQELQENCERLTTELRDLINMSVTTGEAIDSNGRSDSPPNESLDDRLESLGIESLFEFPPLPLTGVTNFAADYGAQPVIDSSSDEETIALIPI